MSTKTVYRLFPPPFESVLRAWYLQQRLHEQGSVEQPFVYANFLASLDGRIALEDDATGVPYLPKSLTTPDDFRLFLELEAQADCLITHGGYLRALHEGRLGNILQIGCHPEHGDLAQWRLDNGLKPQPAVVIASASLDFPFPESLKASGQKVYIATGRDADPARVKHWLSRGHEVLVAGEGRMVEGGALVRALGDRGYRTLYLVAGPHMLDTMVREGRLRRLYQTITHQLMGGESFHTLVPGPVLGPAGHLKMRSLYYDPTSHGDAGQWFAQFDNVPYTDASA